MLGGSLSLLRIAAAVLPVLAGSAQVDIPAARRTVLELRARDASLLRSVQQLLGAPAPTSGAPMADAAADPQGELPATWRVAVLTGGSAGREVLQSPSPEPLPASAYADLRVDPPGLLAAFAPDFAVLRRRAEPGLDLWLRASGLPEVSARLFDACLELAAQLDELRLAIAGDPDGGDGRPLVCELTLAARDQSDLATFVGRLAPSAAGTFAPARDPTATLSLSVDIDPACATDVLAPLAPLLRQLAGLGPDGPALVDEAERLAAAWDGTLYFAAGEHLLLLFGARDATAAGRMLQDPAALERRRRAAARAGRDVEYAPAALVHRDVAMLGITSTAGAGAIHCGVARDCLFAIGGGGAVAARALVDRVLDTGVPRQPLPGGALLQAFLDLPPAAATASDASARPGRSPRRSIRMQVGARARTLLARVELR